METMDIKTCEEYVLNELQVAQKELEETKKKLEESDNAVRYLQQVVMIVAPIVNYHEEDGKVLVGGTNYILDPENDKDLIQALAPLFAPKKNESNEVQDAEEVPAEKAE